jgi:hypothetical protein
MKKLALIITIFALMGFADLVLAVEFEFHGDMNNRFLIYTNRQDWLNNEQDGIIEDSTVEAYYGELKYRFWFEAADDDGAVKGVYAVEAPTAIFPVMELILRPAGLISIYRPRVSIRKCAGAWV